MQRDCQCKRISEMESGDAFGQNILQCYAAPTK